MEEKIESWVIYQCGGFEQRIDKNFPMFVQCKGTRDQAISVMSVILFESNYQWEIKTLDEFKERMKLETIPQ